MTSFVIVLLSSFHSGFEVVGAVVVGTAVDGALVCEGAVFGAAVVGAAVVGDKAVGANVEGAVVVGATVVGANMVGAAVVGAAVVGGVEVGATVVGADVVGINVEGSAVVGPAVVGVAVVGANVGTIFRPIEGFFPVNYWYACFIKIEWRQDITTPLFCHEARILDWMTSSGKHIFGIGDSAKVLNECKLRSKAKIISFSVFCNHFNHLVLQSI